MPRLANLRVVDPVLSQLAVGVTNAENIGGELFPTAIVKKESGQIPKHNRQAFKAVATERALRARSNRLNPDDRDFIKFSMEEHDVSVPMDYRESDESDDLDVETANTILATEAISLRCELIASSLAFNPASYVANNKVTLGVNDKWDKPDAPGNPLLQFSTGSEKIRQAVARRPNTLALGAQAFEALKNNPFVLERMAASMLGVLTQELLAQIVGVKRVLVGDAIGVTDDDVSFDIWGPSALLCYVRPVGPTGKRSVYEPNFGYTVAKKLTEVDKYVEEGGKIQYVRATSIFKTVLTGADAGYLISNVTVGQ